MTRSERNKRIDLAVKEFLGLDKDIPIDIVDGFKVKYVYETLNKHTKRPYCINLNEWTNLLDKI